MTQKTFDCVAMKHRGAKQIREQISDMTLEEELAFWRERSQALRQRQHIAKSEFPVRVPQEESAS